MEGFVRKLDLVLVIVWIDILLFLSSRNSPREEECGAQ